MRIKLLVLALAAFTLTATAQTTAAQSSTTSSQASATGATANASGGTVINAVLDKSVDAKKAKVGDQVEAKTTTDARIGSTVIPRGSKLIGHITEVKAREKGSANAQSSLGIQFDRAVVKGGQDVPVHAVIQAISVPPQGAPVGGDMSASAGPPGGYNQGGGYGTNPNAASRGSTGGTVGKTTSTATNTVGDAPGTVGAAANTGVGTSGQLGANTTGVVGIRDLKLETAASDSARGSMITSDNKNVKLDSGTQLILRVTAQ